MAEAPTETLKSVILNDRHVALGGRMVPFSGYSLPVQYPTGIIAEHKWTRAHAGLFDVSHMGPAFLGFSDNDAREAEAEHARAAAIVEPLVCGDILNLKPGQIRYTLLLNEQGGALDDLMIARSVRYPGTLYIVVNAGTKENDFAILGAAAAAGGGWLHRADDGALLALQGPEAAEVIATLVPDAPGLAFMHYGSFEWHGARLMISRSGYTGEDGFEILAPASHAGELWDTLLADTRVKPIGLGARDSLRLEAGLPLYGHDLDETVSPIEAGLNFAVSKRRREARDFPGAARILAELANGPSRIRVGLLVEGAPAREGTEILGPDGNVVGRVTSGGFSPTLNRAIALGFVPPALSRPGTALTVSVRGRAQPATVAELPFVPHRYVRKAAS
ncbi:MAG TPA: glycine cleavage system aminomethyltransferase GcvT [Alphaproteobacteria bacterium]|nr:glycine cleavage system aminomethyltransferase GcvT [Alphaproteobacteria bacterium]